MIMSQYRHPVTSDPRIYGSALSSFRATINPSANFDQYQYDLQCPHVIKTLSRREYIVPYTVPHNYQAPVTNLKPSRYVILAKIWYSQPCSCPGRYHLLDIATRCKCHVKGKFLAACRTTNHGITLSSANLLPSDQTLRVRLPRFPSSRNDSSPQERCVFVPHSGSPCTTPPVLFGVPGPD
jgi:hypothetical protein